MNYYKDTDGSLVINARVPAEQGAPLLRALEAGTDMLIAEQRSVSAEAGSDTVGHEESNRRPLDVSAETSHPPLSSIRVDALCLVAEDWLTRESSADSDSDRYQVVGIIAPLSSPAGTRGRVKVESSQQGDFIFHSPDGGVLEASPRLPDVRDDNVAALEVECVNR